MTSFPESLGVFTLPNVVLFPHAHLPLHVFEDRYRLLLRDALEGPRMMVMAVKCTAREDEICPIACAASIVEHQPLPDGRSDVILRGERVVRLGRSVAESPYRISRVHPLPREGSFAEEPGARERLQELTELFEQVCPGALESLRTRLHFDPDDDGGLELLHTSPGGSASARRCARSRRRGRAAAARSTAMPTSRPNPRIRTSDRSVPRGRRRRGMVRAASGGPHGGGVVDEAAEPIEDLGRIDAGAHAGFRQTEMLPTARGHTAGRPRSRSGARVDDTVHGQHLPHSRMNGQRFGDGHVRIEADRAAGATPLELELADRGFEGSDAAAHAEETGGEPELGLVEAAPQSALPAKQNREPGRHQGQRARHPEQIRGHGSRDSSRLVSNRRRA